MIWSACFQGDARLQPEEAGEEALGGDDRKPQAADYPLACLKGSSKYWSKMRSVVILKVIKGNELNALLWNCQVAFHLAKFFNNFVGKKNWFLLSLPCHPFFDVTDITGVCDYKAKQNAHSWHKQCTTGCFLLVSKSKFLRVGIDRNLFPPILDRENVEQTISVYRRIIWKTHRCASCKKR